LVGAAVKVTLTPEQIDEPGFAEILILTGKLGFVVMFITFDVAGLPEEHTLLEVISQVMASPLVAEMEKVELFVPTWVVPTCH
jgi:hypothetical protein